MSDVGHLHYESNVVPIREHATMLSQQYLLGCLQSDHPNHHLTNTRASERQMKHSLATKHGDLIRRKAPTGQLTALEAKMAKAEIHTETVRAAISSYKPNKVLNRPPPEIDKTEVDLPRSTRCRLAQLRSGYSVLLNSYNARISGVQDICPQCGQSPHDTQHLFACPACPTNLTTADLWLRPVEAAHFLNL